MNMGREAEFREAVECACDDAWLSLTEIGSILIDLGHKYLGAASAIEARSDATTKIGAAEGESAASEAGDAPTVEVRP